MINTVFRDHMTDTVFRTIGEEDGWLTTVYLGKGDTLCFGSLDKAELRDGLFNIDRFEKVKDPFLFAKKYLITEGNMESAEKRLKTVERVIKKHGTEITAGKLKGRDFDRIAKEEGLKISGRTLKRHILHYYQRGMNVEALLTFYPNCGNRIKSDARRGVKGKAGGDLPSWFYEPVFNHYYRRHYLSMKKPSVNKVYKRMLREVFFNRETGRLEDCFPSRKMFARYVSSMSRKEKKIRREGSRNFNLNERVLYSTDRNLSDGYGHIAMLDATTLDLQIVSEENREKCLGRPTLYLLVDVLTKVIMGYTLGIEPPSYRHIRDLMINVVEEKSAYAEKYGITLDPSDWPVSGSLPRFVLCDNGEMESKAADALVTTLGIAVTNVEPWRGDRKGSVERPFGLINTAIKQEVSGAVMRDYYKRGEADPKKEAKVTLYQCHQLIIRLIVSLNKRRIQDFNLNAKEEAYGVLPVPNKLAAFYKAHNLDLSDKVEMEDILIRLLPNTYRTVGRKGIRLHTLYYSSDEPEIQNFLYENRKKRFLVFFDNRDVSRIWLYSESGEFQIELPLSGISGSYMGKSLEEIIAVRNGEDPKSYILQLEEELKSEGAFADIVREIEDYPSLTKEGRGGSIIESRRETGHDSHPLDIEHVREALKDSEPDTDNDPFGLFD